MIKEKNNKVNCNECKFINITEEEQLDKTINHKCLKYNIRIIHRDNHVGFNSFIYPCHECIGKDFEQRCSDPNEKTCGECNNHRGFIEEDGTMDGCICKHDEGERKYHIDNCMEYTEDYKGCPYFEE